MAARIGCYERVADSTLNSDFYGIKISRPLKGLITMQVIYFCITYFTDRIGSTIIIMSISALIYNYIYQYNYCIDDMK